MANKITPELKQLQKKLTKWFKTTDLKLGRFSAKEFDRVTTIILTEKHKYYISATPTYLGCIAECRYPRPGETWLRGNDLADGRFTESTFHDIVDDIRNYEKD